MMMVNLLMVEMRNRMGITRRMMMVMTAKKVVMMMMLAITLT